MMKKVIILDESKFYIVISNLETTSKLPQSNGNFFEKFSFLKLIVLFSKERRRIRFADPSSSLPNAPSVSRWSDNIPNEEPEFGTPIDTSQPPQYNTVSLYS